MANKFATSAGTSARVEQAHVLSDGGGEVDGNPTTAQEPGKTQPKKGVPGNIADAAAGGIAGAIETVVEPFKDDGDPPGGGGGSSKPSYDENTPLDIPASSYADEAAKLRTELNPEAEKASIDRVNYYDKQPMVDMATQQIELARQQYNNQINQSMDTNAAELNRAVADAQSQYQTQQNQVTANEMNALDNAALYAEARGDKGGIGYAQYNTIQNNAAQNRASISQAQTKLATDTARQIADLRAQGEFDKADKTLELAQTYLSELRQIEEYAADYNLNVDQINTAISEWEYEYNQASQQFATNTELSLAQLTGMFSNGMSTKDAYDTLNQNLAQMALSLIEAGVEPTKLSSEQLSALAEVYGMNQTTINNYFKKATGR